jgi:hypothetical protein
MTAQDDDDPRFANLRFADPRFAELRARPTAPPSEALSARVLASAHAALAEELRTPARARRRVRSWSWSWAVGSVVVAAIGVYLTWAVDFLVRLANT